MKKFLSMVLALCMLLSMSACAMADEAINLRVWVGDNADIEWINGVIANFKAANPDKTYNIEVGVQGEGDCSKVVLNDPEAAADVFTFADDQFNSLYTSLPAPASSCCWTCSCMISPPGTSTSRQSCACGNR